MWGRGGGGSAGRCGAGRRWWRKGTARRADFEVGDRSTETFLRLCGRLPEAELYRSAPYRVYEWLPRNRHVAGKGGVVNRNEGYTPDCRTS